MADRFPDGMATAAAADFPSLARDQAFEKLYRRYVGDVYRYALALLRNPADAEDVTQTTFLNAYRAYQRGEEPIKPQNWLIKIAHNAARTRYARATRRVREVPLEDHIEQLTVPEDDKADVEEVLKALGRLPLNQRAALVMRELEGRTYGEIAETLGVSVSAVETLIFRARRSLRLKSSAVRVLTAVQLPASLAQLLETGGGAVVGGTALIGSGFLFKAAIAVIAGSVAAGLTGDHSRPAGVSALPAGASLADVVAPAPAAVHSHGWTLRTAGASGTGSGRAATRPGHAVRSAGAAVVASQPRSTPTKPSSSKLSVSTAPVTNAVSVVTSKVPSVSAPSVPVPAVPSVPTVPALPSLPAVTTPSALPPPPPLP